MKKKQAYLIMAHNEFDILEKLITLLDDCRSDIYLHIDKKVKNVDYKKIKACVKESNLFFIDRINVQWGGDSQIKCELLLLSNAIKGNYEYYHLLSGVDLPLKTQDEINLFFDKNKGKEFMSFDINSIKNKSFYNRIDQYCFLQNIIGRNSKLQKVEQIFLILQRKLGISRTKRSKIKFFKGANWFSISHEFAKYVLEQKDFIRKNFYCSCCADEIFLQSIAVNSQFKDSIVNDNLREIDWSRGNPYTYTINDFELLTNSPKLWARKFSVKIDKSIINNLFNFLQAKKDN